MAEEQPSTGSGIDGSRKPSDSDRLAYILQQGKPFGQVISDGKGANDPKGEDKKTPFKLKTTPLFTPLSRPSVSEAVDKYNRLRAGVEELKATWNLSMSPSKSQKTASTTEQHADDSSDTTTEQDTFTLKDFKSLNNGVRLGTGYQGKSATEKIYDTAEAEIKAQIRSHIVNLKTISEEPARLKHKVREDCILALKLYHKMEAEAGAKGLEDTMFTEPKPTEMESYRGFTNSVLNKIKDMGLIQEELDVELVKVILELGPDDISALIGCLGHASQAPTSSTAKVDIQGQRAEVLSRLLSEIEELNDRVQTQKVQDKIVEKTGWARELQFLIDSYKEPTPGEASMTTSMVNQRQVPYLLLLGWFVANSLRIIDVTLREQKQDKDIPWIKHNTRLANYLTKKRYWGTKDVSPTESLEKKELEKVLKEGKQGRIQAMIQNICKKVNSQSITSFKQMAGVDPQCKREVLVLEYLVGKLLMPGKKTTKNTAETLMTQKRILRIGAIMDCYELNQFHILAHGGSSLIEKLLTLWRKEEDSFALERKDDWRVSDANSILYAILAGRSRMVKIAWHTYTIQHMQVLLGWKYDTLTKDSIKKVMLTIKKWTPQEIKDHLANPKPSYATPFTHAGRGYAVEEKPTSKMYTDADDSKLRKELLSVPRKVSKRDRARDQELYGEQWQESVRPSSMLVEQALQNAVQSLDKDQESTFESVVAYVLLGMESYAETASAEEGHEGEALRDAVTEVTISGLQSWYSEAYGLDTRLRAAIFWVVYEVYGHFLVG